MDSCKTPEELADFLQSKGVYGEAINSLRAAQVTGPSLVLLTDDDLKDLGIFLGPRRMIQTIIAFEDRDVSSASESVDEMVQNAQPIMIIAPMSTNGESDFVTGQGDNGVNLSSNITADLIKEWVLKFDREQPTSRSNILKKLVDGSCNKARLKLVQIVCAELVALFGNYPSSETKEDAARAIVSAFPKLKSDCYADSHKHFYDKTTNMGFLVFRFKTLRKNLNPANKKRRPSFPSKQIIKRSKPLPYCEGIPLSAEECNEKTYAVKYIRSTEENRRQIFSLMDEMRPNRIQEILYPEDSSNLMTITSIVEKYPKFKDYEGELIEREFNSLYPDGDTFLRKFAGFYVPRILRLISRDENRQHLLELVDGLSDEFKALVLLPEILPAPNHTKKKGTKSSVRQRKMIPHPCLIRIIDNQENLLAHTKAKGPQQPYLLHVPEAGGNGQFYIRADSHLIEVARNPLKAFDCLLKLHFCFGVEYAPELTNFYDFITACVMGLEGVEPRPCCAALKAMLLNVERSSPVTVEMDITETTVAV